MWEGFSISVKKQSSHLYDLLLYFFSRWNMSKIGKKAHQSFSRSESNGSHVCTWSGKPQFLQTLQRNICQLWVPFRFWSFGGFHGNYFLLYCQCSTSFFKQILSYIFVSWDDFVCVCVWKEVKMRNKFTQGIPDHLSMMGPTIVSLSENHTEDQKIKVEDHWMLLLSAFPNTCFI